MTRLITQATLHELLRRRTALLFTVLLPLAFYLVRLDTAWTAVRLLSIGLGWAVATLALFTHVAARDLDRRLVVAGAKPLQIHTGRQLAVTLLGLILAVAYFALVAATSADKLTRLWPALVLLALTVLISAPLGAIVAIIVPRELEGALLLLSIMAVQVLVDPDKGWTKALPLWSTREITSYAVQPVDATYLTHGLLHGAATLLILTTVSAVIAQRRLATHPIPAPAANQ